MELIPKKFKKQSAKNNVSNSMRLKIKISALSSSREEKDKRIQNKT
jgi:hypothetical protein